VPQQLVKRLKRSTPPKYGQKQDRPPVERRAGERFRTLCQWFAAWLTQGDYPSKPHWNGWGVDPSQHRFQSSDMAGLAESDLPRLKLKWAFGFPGATRPVAQPTIVGGRLFVGSQGGKVYSLDAKSGCTIWEFGARKGVRSAIVIGQRSDGWAAYFGDAGANVYSVDALTGKELWRTKVDDHPAAVITGSPTLVGATLFVPVSSYEEVTGANKSYPCCTFRGSVVALDASTGKVLWKAFSIAEEAKPGATNAAGVQPMGPSGAAIWSAPTFDVATKRIYATTGDNYSDPPTETSDAILAFDAGSGERTWTRRGNLRRRIQRRVRPACKAELP
jgi:polyvinyl alcohol dehydrogenase (cytochrome)